MNSPNFEDRYNNGTTGSFRTGQSRGIGSDDFRDLVTKINESFLNSSDELELLVVATGTNDYEIDGDLSGLSTGQSVFVKFTNASTGATTLNRNALGAKKLFINPTTQAGDGHIPENAICLCVYDSTLDSSSGGFLIIAGLNVITGGTP